MGKPYIRNQETFPLRAIRSKCLDCSCGRAREVERRPVTDCALWPFRFGKRPQTHAKHAAKRQAVPG